MIITDHKSASNEIQHVSFGGEDATLCGLPPHISCTCRERSFEVSVYKQCMLCVCVYVCVCVCVCVCVLCMCVCMCVSSGLFAPAAVAVKGGIYVAFREAWTVS